MCIAPEIPPEIFACNLSLGIPLPAKNCAPPLENWMIIGEFTLAAASSAALTVSVPVTLTAGRANWLFFASLYNASSSSPNNTPGLYFFIFEGTLDSDLTYKIQREDKLIGLHGK